MSKLVNIDANVSRRDALKRGHLAAAAVSVGMNLVAGIVLAAAGFWAARVLG